MPQHQITGRLLTALVAAGALARKIFVVALALTSLGAGAASAQSFDCARAASSNEKLICSDPALGQLDLELEANVRRALDAAPAERERLLAEARRWVKERDRQCAREGSSARDENVECLTKAYGERIAGLAKAAQSLPRDTSVCRRVVELYRSVIENNPQATKGHRGARAAYSVGPFEALLAAKTPGVSEAKTNDLSSAGSPEKIAAWAHSQRPSFVFPDELMKALSDDRDNAPSIDRLPGADYYSAYRIEGTMHCIYAHYFIVRDGRARPAAAPTGWLDDEGASCGADRFFATIDDRPVAIEDDGSGFAPNPNVNLTISPWLEDHFGPLCEASFEFAPAFIADVDGSDATAETHACVGGDCDRLRQAALALVEDLEASPRNALQKAMAQLTPAQQRQYAALSSDFPLAKAADASAALADDLMDSEPLAVPALRDGKVCRALAGHNTAGWRIFADWSVKLECRENGTLLGPSFVIGMGRGRLVSATVR